MQKPQLNNSKDKQKLHSKHRQMMNHLAQVSKHHKMMLINVQGALASFYVLSLAIYRQMVNFSESYS